MYNLQSRNFLCVCVQLTKIYNKIWIFQYLVQKAPKEASRSVLFPFTVIPGCLDLHCYSIPWSIRPTIRPSQVQLYIPCYSISLSIRLILIFLARYSYICTATAYPGVSVLLFVLARYSYIYTARSYLRVSVLIFVLARYSYIHCYSISWSIRPTIRPIARYSYIYTATAYTGVLVILFVLARQLIKTSTYILPMYSLTGV